MVLLCLVASLASRIMKNSGGFSIFIFIQLLINILIIGLIIRFLLIKCINGEKATYNTGVFSTKRERTFQVNFDHDDEMR